jgi:hypothetical protein
MTPRKLYKVWRKVNREYFCGSLCKPRIFLADWLNFNGYDCEAVFYTTEARPKIGLLHPSRDDTLARMIHEMIHQYQIEILKVEPDHDLTFAAIAGRFLPAYTIEDIL